MAAKTASIDRNVNTLRRCSPYV